MEAVFLQDLAVVMIVAGLVTLLCHRFRLPVVLGYLIAGLLIGPHMVRLVLPEGAPQALLREEETIETLAQLGVVFLMFSLGLHFSIRRLMKVGLTALVAGALELTLMVWLGYQLGRLLGWENIDALFLGAIVSISSSTIIAKALRDTGRSRESFAQIIFGILIVEDILAIALIVLLSSVATTHSVNVRGIAHTFGMMGIFLTVVLVAGLLLVPMLLRVVARYRSQETMLITSLALCFGVSLLAAKLGYSVALGAFLIGAIIAETRQQALVEELIGPLRDMFSAVFFVAVGMLIDPAVLPRHAVPIAAATVLVIAGKIFAVTAGVFLTGQGGRTALRVGIGMAQIGEFSFIIAQLGQNLPRPTGAQLYPIAVAVSALTTLAFPFLMRRSDQLVSWSETAMPPAVRGYFELYSQWVRPRWNPPASNDPVRRIVRRTVLQLLLNLALMTATFLGAAYLAIRVPRAWVPPLPDWTGGHYTLAWIAAVILCLPLLVATVRKVRAMAMLLAELSVPAAAAQRHTMVIRAIISNTILVSGVATLGLVVLVLSTTILPPWPIVAAILVLMVAVAIVKRPALIQLYARAQVALEDTLRENPEPAPPASPAPAAPALPSMLQAAGLETVVIAADSPAAGKLIRDFPLRASTGVSAVAIDRAGNHIVNPGPDEELLAGDRVLLLGSPEQLEAARSLLGNGNGQA